MLVVALDNLYFNLLNTKYMTPQSRTNDDGRRYVQQSFYRPVKVTKRGKTVGFEKAGEPLLVFPSFSNASQWTYENAGEIDDDEFFDYQVLYRWHEVKEITLKAPTDDKQEDIEAGGPHGTADFDKVRGDLGSKVFVKGQDPSTQSEFYDQGPKDDPRKG